MTNPVPSSGGLYERASDNLGEIDSERLQTLNTLFLLIPNAVEPKAIHDITHELSKPDRDRLYFAMKRASIAAGIRTDTSKDPKFSAHSFKNVDFDITVRQNAVILMAFEAGLITTGPLGMETNFTKGLSALTTQRAQELKPRKRR